MSERDVFEKWFAFAYGSRPAGDPDQIKEEILDLQQQETRIRIWEAEYRAALGAWAERRQIGAVVTTTKETK